jgi:hypothetical protein
VSDSGRRTKWLVCCVLPEPIYSCNTDWTPSPSLRSPDRLIHQPYAPNSTRNAAPHGSGRVLCQGDKLGGMFTLDQVFLLFSSTFLLPLKNISLLYSQNSLRKSITVYRASFSCSAIPELVQGSAPHSDPRTLWERHPCAWCHLGRKATPGCCMVKSSPLFDLCSHQSLHWKPELIWTESIYFRFVQLSEQQYNVTTQSTTNVTSLDTARIILLGR